MGDYGAGGSGGGGDNRTVTYVRAEIDGGLRPGFVLRERFVLERQLGEGGMGRVFLALDRQLEASDRYVAIKVLGDTFRDHPYAFDTLRREATNARKLNHPNIVGVYDFDRDGPHVFMVMEYMRGQSLDVFVRQHPQGLPYKEAWPIVRSCGEALEYMHTRGIVHSDFKPANVFLTDEGTTKVLDLGIARTVKQTMALTVTTRFDPKSLGALTPQYASCEMFEGMAPDARDDVYALGCVCYELLTGHHPFDRLTALEARTNQLKPRRPKGLPRPAWRALQRALSLDRVHRASSAAEFLAAFGPERRRGSPMPWIAASGLLVVAGAGMGYAYLRPDPDRVFIEEAMARGGTGATASDEQIDLWLEQGRFLVSEAQKAFADQQWERGRFFLSESPSSARAVLSLALRRSESVDDRRAAADGLLEVSRTLTIPVAKLFPDDLEGGLSYLCEGLRLNPYQPELRRLHREYAAGLEKASDGLCEGIDWGRTAPP